MIPKLSNSRMWKEAARAGMRRLISAELGGNTHMRDLLQKTPGVVRATAAGSSYAMPNPDAAGLGVRALRRMNKARLAEGQAAIPRRIQDLGRGSEGLATPVFHAEHGHSVRKLYDPRGIASDELIKRKEVAGKAIGKNPYISEFHGSAPTPNNGGTMHFSELVKRTSNPTSIAYDPQKTLPPGATPVTDPKRIRENLPGVRKAKAETILASRRAGFRGGAGDARYGNMVEHAPGKFKTVDYMPVEHGELAKRTKDTPSNVLGVTAKGSDTLLSSQMGQSVDSASLKRSMLGRSTAPVIPKAPAAAPTTPLLPATIANKPRRPLVPPTASSAAATVPGVFPAQRR